MTQAVPGQVGCPRCGATSRSGERFCIRCGRELPVPAVAEPAGPSNGQQPAGAPQAWRPRPGGPGWPPPAGSAGLPPGASGWPPPAAAPFGGRYSPDYGGAAPGYGGAAPADGGRYAPAAAPPVAVWTPPATTPPARRAGRAASGWYPDPFGRFRFRYWDGTAWSQHAFTSAPVVDPLPRWLDGSQRFSAGRSTVVFALLGLVVPYGLAALAEFGCVWLHVPGGPYLLLVVFSTVFWAGLLTTCNLASRRFGTGSLRADLQVRFRPVDLLIAIGGAMASLVLAGIVALLIEHLRVFHLPVPSEPLVPSTTVPAAAWAVLIVCTCIGAPIFEELYFRGLLQTVLVERVGPVGGVVLTALVFACGHIFNAPGLAGVAYAMEIVAAGLVLCFIRITTGRLGSSMVTHSLYNSSVLLLLAVHLGYFRH